MNKSSRELEDFREKIDEIDARIHELIMTRAGIGQEIGRKKGAEQCVATALSDYKNGHHNIRAINLRRISPA